MKNLRTSAWLVSFALIASLVTACAKSGDGGGTVGGDGTPLPGVTPVTFPGAGSRIGFFAQNQKMTDYNRNSQGTSYQIANTTNATTLLRNIMGVCDRNHSDGGGRACPSWLSGYQDIVLFADGAQTSSVKLIFRAYPNDPSYYFSLPSFKQFFQGLLGFNTTNMSAMYNPMVLDTTSINPINKNLGFEVRANAPKGATFQGGVNNLIHFSVEQGKLEDAGWDFKVFLNNDPINQLIYTGHAARCQTQDCSIGF